MPCPEPVRFLRANRTAGRAAMVVAFGVIVALTADRTVQAGDILRRGNGGASVTTSNGVNSNNAASAQAASQAAVISKRAQDTLTRATQALQNMQTMQTAAQTSAKSSSTYVPNGLVSGGLQVDSSSTWTGANQPSSSTSNGAVTVTVKQTTQNAFLNWKSFNIGRSTTLYFDQTNGGTDSGQWIAFNQINDPNGSPSKILGTLKADGQVYVINQNGIIFGGASQVNAHALVASSLPINTVLQNRGLLNNNDKEFLFSITTTSGIGGTMDPFTPTSVNNTIGDITVESGATLTSPTTSDHVGGKIALIGPNVTNEGTISAADGQIILAAGLQVGWVEHKSTDASIRGLDVYVGQGGGTVQNSSDGILDAPRGNITMVGKTVNQLGAAKSTTSVSLNGSIILDASYNSVTAQDSNGTTFAPKASGLVNLGQSSVTQVLPELTSTETVVGNELTLSSKIDIRGYSVYFGVNSQVLASSGNVTVSAGTWQSQGGTYKFLNTDGQIYLDVGATIDVTGSENIDASVTDNIVSVQLRGTELADSPTQRNGTLRGTTVKVDARKSGVYNGKTWVGTPLADASGYVSLVKHTVGQLTTSGGSVALNAGGSVVMQTSSKIDVSGGWLNYKGGTVQTTRLISGGHLYDISAATPDLVYDGIYSGFTETHSRWGVSNTYTSSILNGSHYESGYLEGGSAGTVAISAPSMALDGNLYGNTVTGQRQHTNAPSSGALTLSFQKVDATTRVASSPSAPSVTFDSNSTQAAVEAFSASALSATLTDDRKNKVVLSTDLVNENGFGVFTLINSDGDVTVPASVSLNVTAGGAFTLAAANIDIEGKVSVPGGSINMVAYNYSPYASFLLTSASESPKAVSTRGSFKLGSSASLSTAGLTIDDRSTSSTAETVSTVANGLVVNTVNGSISENGATFNTTLIRNSGNTMTRISTDSGKTTITNYNAKSITTTLSDTGKSSTTVVYDDGTTNGLSQTYDSVTTSLKNGGSLSIASYNATLSEGSKLDVSGGLLIAGNGKVSYGNGGSLSIKAGQDPILKYLLGGKLSLSADMEGYAGYGAAGGKLSILAPFVQVGGATSNASTLLVDTSFFDEGGFSSFSLTGIGSKDSDTHALDIVADTEIEPKAQTRLALVTADGFEWETKLLPEGSRSPVSLTFAASAGIKNYTGDLVTRGDVVLEEGASILTDANASVTLSGGDTVTVLGSVTAPGGTIKVTGAKDSTLLFPTYSGQAVPTVDLGPKSVLSTAGKVVLIPDDARGRRTGSVVSGGSITVDGNIVAESGALLDVSGASGVLDVLNTTSDTSATTNGSLKGAVYKATTVDSNGGSITLTGEQQLVTDATLLGKAGGSSASGGSLTVQSGRFIKSNEIQTPTDITMTVTQSGPLIGSFYSAGETGIGHPVLDTNGKTVDGVGNFAADSFMSGGFDSLTIPGVVNFSGAVSITAPSSLSIADGGFIYGNSSISLKASYVSVGTKLQTASQSYNNIDPYQFQGVDYHATPTYGAGSLTVTADLIDIGYLSLQNIGKANFVANNGDIRGDGALDVAGDITMTAGQIYPVTETSFTIAAYDYQANGKTNSGSVTFNASGSRELPYSAGGTLNVYASTINQGGVLRAPFGTINLGSKGTETGLISNQTFSTTKQITLSAGSITSVSGVDPVTGEELNLPYGTNVNGISWSDPAGNDITSTGLSTKTISIYADKIDDQSGSSIDIRGGGDLYSSRFVKGTGGSTDILSSTKSFAVIPGYEANYSPATTDSSSTTLKVGDKVYLGASSGLAAGVYTLLPASYALQSGAFLVTQLSGVATGTVVKSDGSSLVSGYRYNGLNSSRTGSQLSSRFEVASSSVVADRAKYETYSATTYWSGKTTATTTRSPIDSGHLIFSASSAMKLDGNVYATAPTGGRGGLVDISSVADIVISGAGATGQDGKVVLDASKLSGYGAESLLIGGVRGSNETSVTVYTNNLTLDNAGSALTGPDVILVANKSLTVANGADIEQKGTVSGAASSLVVSDVVNLKNAGDSITLPQGGVTVTFGKGTPGNDAITSTRPGTITYADGSTTGLSANNSVSLPAGASITLSSADTVTSTVGGTIKYADGSTATLAASTATSIPAGATLTLSSVGSLTSDRAGTITKSDGSTASILPNVFTSIPAGAKLTFTDASTIKFASGGTSIPVTLGDGLLVRVSSDSGAKISRSGVTNYKGPSMVIGSGAILSGNSVIIDSTDATSLNSSAVISGNAVSLNSGQISLEFGNQGISDLKTTSGNTTTGLVLTGNALQTLMNSTKSLSLTSYSSIDIYGAGSLGGSTFENLEFHAGDIRGFNSGDVTFTAQTILIDNSKGAQKPSAVDGESKAAGSLNFSAKTIELGVNQVNVEFFSSVSMLASAGIQLANTGGFSTQGALTLTTPALALATGANQTLSASGALVINKPAAASSASVQSGLGASLTLQGGSITANADIVLPSGNLTLHATGNKGDVYVGDKIDVAGTGQIFYDLIKYTDGGKVTLTSDYGNVTLAAGSSVDVGAMAGGGDAGSLAISAVNGAFTAGGSLDGKGGANGTFSLDVSSLSNLAQIDTQLNNASFTLARSYRVRNNDVTMSGYARAQSYSLEADQGGVTVAGVIDAHGAHGGTIRLTAKNDIQLQAGSWLNVIGTNFDNAGKGGSVSIESTQGWITLAKDSTIDLGVTNNTDTSASAALGKFNGTLHLRALQNSAGSDLQVNAIDGNINNASYVLVEGYRKYDINQYDTTGAGKIDYNVESQIQADGSKFLDNTGGNTSTYNTMLTRLLGAHNTALDPIIETGAEIVNATGDLTLTSDWDLSSYRFGVKNAPGVLTLRAAGNLIFNGSLSDGFASSSYKANLLSRNAQLPANAQSWSYRMAAGADFSAADFHAVQSLATLNTANLGGSLQLGVYFTGYDSTPNYGAYGNTTIYGLYQERNNTLTGHYQVIRTGSGDIDIVTGRNVEFHNQFAAIYTAGTVVSDPSLGNTFDKPLLYADADKSRTKPLYAAQYSYAGGNVTISAQWNMQRQNRVLVNGYWTIQLDSELETPTSWLYRRGEVNSTTGYFTKGLAKDIQSTTWWVDFSNFYESVGALGGGNVTLIAGNDVNNVDAVAPTNARMPGYTDSTKTTVAKPDASKLVELGGGDVTVRAGHDINGGIYYVERGNGTLSAGNDIALHSDNKTRSSLYSPQSTKYNPDRLPDSTTVWLPTTLYLGKGSFDVSANGDLEIGSVVNAFLMPQGIYNTYWYKTYFCTYATTDSVSLSSVTGAVTLRENSTSPQKTTLSNFSNTNNSLLANWMSAELIFTGDDSTSAYYRPWISVVETSMDPFNTVMSLMPSSLSVTAFSGDINVVGSLTLSPSPTGTLDFAASGDINGLCINGQSQIQTAANTYVSVPTWGTATINLSDANPSNIRGVASPYSYQTFINSSSSRNLSPTKTASSFLSNVFDKYLIETGATSNGIQQLKYGQLQVQQALHDSSVLHANDTTPAYLYAGTGDISGLTLYSSKETLIMAGGDITDISFYIQNVKDSDISIVAAGGDIIAYDKASTQRITALNLDFGLDLKITAQAGDIQINGPGTIEVLAGGDLDLGTGSNVGDGTGMGLTSIGNSRNPYLPFAGASIVVAAGLGGVGFDYSSVSFSSFVSTFLNPDSGGSEATRYLPLLGELMDLTDKTNSEIWTAFEKKSAKEQQILALDIFFLVLRDAGRDHSDSTKTGYGNYDAGYSAINTLFSGSSWKGDISLTSREIKTKNGGDVCLIAPGGLLNVGFEGTGTAAQDQGIFTEHGGNIYIFTHDSVNVGNSRIFTLRGGNEIIWSTVGDIAAGISSKTVQSAPPTRVLIDSVSANVKTDLSGLATGGGIGALETVSDVAASDIDLIAPSGTVDAGDAGIRASGNLNVSAVQILNASNIQVGGASTGTPVVVSSNLGSVQLSAQNTTTTSNSAAEERAAAQRRAEQAQQEDVPSLITVEVIGYGGGEGD